MDTIGEPAASNRVDRVAGLMRALVDLEPLSTVFEHLRHEGQSLLAARFIKRKQNLIFATDLNPIATAKLCHLYVLSYVNVRTELDGRRIISQHSSALARLL